MRGNIVLSFLLLSLVFSWATESEDAVLTHVVEVEIVTPVRGYEKFVSNDSTYVKHDLETDGIVTQQFLSLTNIRQQMLSWFNYIKDAREIYVVSILIVFGVFFGYLDYRDRVHQARIPARIMSINDPEVTEVQKFGFPWYYFCAVLCFHISFFYWYFLLLEERTSGLRGNVIKWGLVGVVTWSLIYYFLAIWDVLLIVLMPDQVKCERTTAHTHVIVAAHKAEDSIRIMLPRMLKTFDPDCVWVADNGWKDDAVEELCNELGVHYLFNEIGNKCNALTECALKIKHDYGDEVKNVVLLDDDTLLDDTFFIRHDLLENPKVGGYCIAIGVNRNKESYNLWETAIDFEYRSISYSGQAVGTCASMRFVHGICAVYKLDIVLEMFPKNFSLPGGLPFGEDGYAGVDIRRAGYRTVQDNQNMCFTFCPPTLFPRLTSTAREQGYGASSLWKQRGNRWFLSWPRHFLREVKLLFTYKSGSWVGFLVYRLVKLHMHVLYCNIFQNVPPPTLFVLLPDRVYFISWLFLGWMSIIWLPFLLFAIFFQETLFSYIIMLKIFLYLTSLLITIIRISFFPTKLRSGLHWSAPLVVPILGITNSFLRVYAFVKAIYKFIPFARVGNLKLVLSERNYRELGFLEKKAPKIANGHGHDRESAQ